MKKTMHAPVILAALSLAAAIPPALAAQTDTGDTSGEVTENGPGIRPEQATPKQEAGTAAPAKASEQGALAPHAIFVHSSLENARNEITALKDQLKLVQSQGVTPTLFTHLELHRKAIQSDIQNAGVHAGEMKAAAEKYPDVAQSSDYQTLENSVRRLQGSDQTWQSKASEKIYWKNVTQARADLDSLENEINQALSQSKTFASSQLSFPLTG